MPTLPTLPTLPTEPDRPMGRRRVRQAGGVQSNTRRDTIRTRIVVRGRVQGVFFRDTCRREALRRGVHGWVRNRLDGGVEAAFEGPPADVRTMVEWAKVGPPMARVDRIEVHDEAPEGLVGFEVRPTR